MSSGLTEYSLLTATNKLEIALNPMETWEMHSREGLESLCETNKNQHDTWHFTAKVGWCTLLSTVAKWRDMLLNCADLSVVFKINKYLTYGCPKNLKPFFGFADRWGLPSLKKELNLNIRKEIEHLKEDFCFLVDFFLSMKCLYNFF